MESKKKKIILFPLDWGLGHVTRSLVVAKILQKEGYALLFGVPEKYKEYIQKEMPEAVIFPVQGYNIIYSSWMPQWLKVALQFHKVLRGFFIDTQLVKKTLREHSESILISDGRLGMAFAHGPRILINHQITLPAPFFSQVVNAIQRIILRRFSEIWVPDFSNHLLTGSLSKGLSNSQNIRYIGPLQRLQIPKNLNPSKKLLILLSGPEPQRSILEELLASFIPVNMNYFVIRGTSKKMIGKNLWEHDRFIDLATQRELEIHIAESSHIICRPGYTTVMELFGSEKSLCFIPTPGQTEQEYLADYYKEQFGITAIKQHLLSMEVIHNFFAGSGVFTPPAVGTVSGTIPDLLSDFIVKNFREAQ